MAQSFPTLFKVSSTGKISQWEIWVAKDNGVPCYIIRHGYTDGAKQTKSTLVAKGKNTGRANETTPEEQCEAEALSKWTKQIERKGYSEKIEQERALRPMLAKSYNYPGSDLTNLKDGHAIQFPCFYQPKLDGLRCLAVKKNGQVRLFSRQGKEFKVLDKIVEELDLIMVDDEIFDGELYCHDLEFQNIVSAIKRDKKSDLTDKIEYHIYDRVSDDDFRKRIAQLIYIFVRPMAPHVKLVETKRIESKDELRDIHDEMVHRGYEGVILRNMLGGYAIDKRSANLQKVKAFDEEEFVIVDAYENPKMPGTCTFLCQTLEGDEFGCQPEGSQEIRAQYWLDWKLGNINPGDKLTVRFFGWTTSEEPVPRFPIGKSIRNYES